MASLKQLLSIGRLKEHLKTANIPTPLWYANNGAPAEMVELVSLGNKKFGSIMEHITCDLFDCQKVKDVKGKTGWDLNKNNSRIELKSSRYWRMANKNCFRWQHVLADHEWSYLMCVGIDFQKIRYFIASKPQFMKLIEEGAITQQGGAGGQGCWFSSEDISGKIHEFQSPENHKSLSLQLVDFIENNPSSQEPIPSEQINAALALGAATRELVKVAKNEVSKKLKEEKAKLKEEKAKLRQEKAKLKQEKVELKKKQIADKKAAKNVKLAKKM